MFAKQSMINRLSNPINRNRSAAKISKVMSSSLLAYMLKFFASLGGKFSILGFVMLPLREGFGINQPDHYYRAFSFFCYQST